ncbi:hypothetical protein ACFLTZ_00445 [Chloroflexota bacterium]
MVEVYGLGKVKGPNRLFPSFLALSKRMLGTYPRSGVNPVVIVAIQLIF